MPQFSSEQASSSVIPPRGPAAVERAAANLYRLASMLVGEGEQTVELVESAVFDSPSASRITLAAGAISLLRSRDASALAAPAPGVAGPSSCIEDDDLDAAGVSSSELEHMLSGPDRKRLRAWLEGLETGLRVVFVLRAIGDLTSGEIAGLLATHGGPEAKFWTADQVRDAFRQALCSLSGQLLHESVTR